MYLRLTREGVQSKIYFPFGLLLSSVILYSLPVFFPALCWLESEQKMNSFRAFMKLRLLA